MSTGFAPRRRWNGQRRSNGPTSADELARYGIPSGAPTASLDRAREIATGQVPGARRIDPRPTFAQPAAPAPQAPAPAPVQTTGRADFWQVAQRIRAQGATKTTSVTAAPGGVVVNVSTRTGQGVAEALVFIPGATVADFVRA